MKKSEFREVHHSRRRHVSAKKKAEKSEKDRLAKNYDRETPNYVPEKVDVVSKVVEKTECFSIDLSCTVEDAQAWLGTSCMSFSKLVDPSRIMNGVFCSSDLVLKLWAQKARIDEFFDRKEESFYYRARNSLFPQDQKGSKNYRNRAGDKLFEVDSVTGIISSQKSGVFFDVCGGPGSWSEVLLSGRGNCKWRGFGMTLKLPNTPLSDMWYEHLVKDSRWKALWGSDGTGDVYVASNLTAARDEVKGLCMPVSLVVADGGFHISVNSNGQHQENLQELHSARIILSELVACLLCMTEGGSWCCKMFDTFSLFSASLVYVTGLCFEKTFVVKPFRSRIVNSERYLVGKSFKKRTPQLEALIQHVVNIHSSWKDGESDLHPDSLVPESFLKGDEKFLSSFSLQVVELCKKQTEALEQVMDLAGDLRSKEKTV